MRRFSFRLGVALRDHHLGRPATVSNVLGVNTRKRLVSLALGFLDSVAVSLFVLVVIRVIL